MRSACGDKWEGRGLQKWRGRKTPAPFSPIATSWLARYAIFLAAVVFTAIAARAAGSDDAPQVKTVLVLASGLSLADLRAGGPIPSVRALANQGGIALLNTAVSGDPTDAAAFLSVGASERMSAPDQEGEPRFAEAGVSLSADDLAREAYPARGPGARLTGDVYRRRFGETMPHTAAMVHLGVPALMRTQSLPSRAALVGAFGDALERTGLRVAVVGDYRAVLVAMNCEGLVARGALEPSPTPAPVLAALSVADVVVVVPATTNGAERITRALLPLAKQGRARIVFASVAPPRAPNGAKWARLGFVVVCGRETPPGSVLTSPTTRTRGLAASIDLAPTVLGVAVVGPAPTQSFGGRALEAVFIAPGTAWDAVALLDRQVNAATAATVPVLVAYGVFAIGSGLAALVILSLRERPPARVVKTAKFALLTAAAVLIAFLPVGIIAPLSPLHFGLLTLCIAVALAAAAQFVAKRFGASPLALLLMLAAVVVSVDAVFGSPLVARALLSNFYLAGIRFYGIGNEYMGLTIGAALVGGALLKAPSDGPQTPKAVSSDVLKPPFALVLLAPLTLCAVGLPFFGADAGGAIGATVTYTVAFWALRRRHLRTRHIIAAFAIAGAVVIALALADRARPASARTHVGAAIATGQSRGAGAVAEIAARKVAMNARIAVHPATLGALLLLAPMAWAVGRGPLAIRTRRALGARPVLRRVVLPAGAWGAFASFVFNDSGVIAAILLLAPVLVMVFDVLLDDAMAPELRLF